MKSYYDPELDDVIYSVSKLVDVVSVDALDDYKLLVSFSDGAKKIYDVFPLINQGVFKALQDESFFRKAEVRYGTVAWGDKIDIAPEALYKDGKSKCN